MLETAEITYEIAHHGCQYGPDSVDDLIVITLTPSRVSLKYVPLYPMLRNGPIYEAYYVPNKGAASHAAKLENYKEDFQKILSTLYQVQDDHSHGDLSSHITVKADSEDEWGHWFFNPREKDKKAFIKATKLLMKYLPCDYIFGDQRGSKIPEIIKVRKVLNELIKKNKPAD